MILGGLQKTSLVDYPGKVSCVCFLMGCNFDCPYCHNPYLVRKDLTRLLPVRDEELCAFLDARKEVLDGVVISGGEPTLNSELLSLCERIKAMGYPVKLDTNGSRPEVIRALVAQGLVDYIAMDIKTEPLKYPLFIRQGFDPESLLSSIRLIMEWGADYEFKTTCVKPLIDSRAIEVISQIIHGARLYALQFFQDREVLHPEFFEGSKAGHDHNQMTALKSIADPWVKRCIVR